jgi:hypothetical protein
MKCPALGVNMGDGMAMTQLNAEPAEPRNPHITTVLPKDFIEFEAGETYRITIEKEGTAPCHSEPSS